MSCKHIEQIRKALQLNHIHCEIGSWRYVPRKNSQEQGAQIDLLFDRDDDAITICEIKYNSNQLVIDKAYVKNLMNKLTTFEKYYATKKQIFIAIICNKG